jgi:hypothetical protein
VPIVAESPKELAADTHMPPSRGTSTLPTREGPTDKVGDLADSPDPTSNTQKGTEPVSSLSRAAMAPTDAVMEIKQPTNLPDNTPSGEFSHQTITRSSQFKVDAAAKHRTVLKEIWARRVL